MNPLTVCAFGMVALCIISALRQLKAEFAPFAAAAAGALIFGYCLSGLASTVGFLKGLIESGGFASWFSFLVKALAIAVACQICADICRDCGESSLASRIETAGKLGIVMLSLPLLQSVLQSAKDLLN